jgi:hypothetical protein
MPTEVKNCDCKHAYQDKQYGKNKRVWNIGATKKSCTVCGKSEKTNKLVK